MAPPPPKLNIPQQGTRLQVSHVIGLQRHVFHTSSYLPSGADPPRHNMRRNNCTWLPRKQRWRHLLGFLFLSKDGNSKKKNALIINYI